ncbi:unnamed protein product [Prorocentrum cordatum]|uniref:PAS domain-containing protein n=1 Tax=Prorocentrum cordatum TaxID=2364126 RepID=A0ABN9QW19_9DINO|nr:unnamed protein product [Polarella glacialis]
MLREPLRGDCCEGFVVRTTTEDPVWRCAFAVGQAVRVWWRQTTGSQYLASPTSRRQFWRYYWISILFWLASWIGLTCAGEVTFGIAEQWFLLSLVLLMLLSLAMTALPTTSVWSDIFITTTFSVMFWMLNVHSPLNGVITQLPVYILVCWALGLHSSCVLYFGISGGICVLHCAPSVDPLILVQAMVVFVPVFFLEWLGTAHFWKLQDLLNVSTDGQLIINRSTGVVVTVTEQVQELLGGSTVGTQFKHFVHSSDRAQIDRLCSTSRGEPWETFLATLHPIDSSKGMPTHEFDACIIPYEITGPLLHFCVQVVGEVRSCDFGTRSEQSPMENSSAAPGSTTLCNSQQTPINTSSATLAQIERHSRQGDSATPVAHQGHQDYGQQSMCRGDEAAPPAEHQGLGLCVGQENSVASSALRERQDDGGTSSNAEDAAWMALHESPDETDASAGRPPRSPAEGAAPPRGPPGASAGSALRRAGLREPAGGPGQGGRGRPNQLLPARAAGPGGGRAPRAPPAGGVGASEAGQVGVPAGSGALGARRSQRSRAPLSGGAVPVRWVSM